MEQPDTQRKLQQSLGKAIADHQMIEDGDRILIALSGGKDSYVLARLLIALRKKAPVSFELAAVNLDPGYKGYQPKVVEQWARAQGLDIHMLEAPIEELVAAHIAPGKAACPLCSRVRRGAFYDLADKIAFNKIALGHHFDDVAETVLINAFYAGTLRGMPPHLRREGESVNIIRPLAYCMEKDIQVFATASNFPVIPCASPHCGAADRRRQVIKKMLTELEADHPDVRNQLRRALGNLQPDTLLAPRI